MPAKPCPEVPVFEPLQGWGLHHCPGQPGPRPDHSFSKEIFLNIQSEPPLMQLEAVASCPIARMTGHPSRKLSRQVVLYLQTGVLFEEMLLLVLCDDRK